MTALYQGTTHLVPGWGKLSVAHRIRLAERLTGWQGRFPDLEVTRSVVGKRPAKALSRAAEPARLFVRWDCSGRGCCGSTGTGRWRSSRAW